MGDLVGSVLSPQAASIGQIPVVLCCLGLLLTPLLVIFDARGDRGIFFIRTGC